MKFRVRRTNDDRFDDTFEWLLLSGSQVVAVSWHNYTTAKGAQAAARKVGHSFGIAYPYVEMPSQETA